MSQAINVRINDRDDIVVNSGSNKENDKKVDLLFDVYFIVIGLKGKLANAN